MIALKTSLNGRQLCVAGSEDLCVLNAIVNALGKLGEKSTSKNKGGEAPDLFLSVGGLAARADSDGEYLRWREQEPLSVGDEVCIEIMDVSDADAPISRADASDTIKDQELRRYEEAKKVYFSLRDKFEPDC